MSGGDSQDLAEEEANYDDAVPFPAHVCKAGVAEYGADHSAGRIEAYCFYLRV